MLLRQHPFEVRKISGELAAEQQPVAELEEQMILIAAKSARWHPDRHRRPAFEARPSLSAAAAPDTRRVTPGSSPELSTIARRCPSVATIARPPFLSTSSAPFSVKRDSSLEIAKMVLRDHRRQHADRNLRQHLRHLPAVPENFRATCRRCASSSGRTPGSPSGSPESSPEHRLPAAGARNPASAAPESSRARLSSPARRRNSGFPTPDPSPSAAIRSPSASTRTFDRIGIVVFFSTTPCERFSSRTRSALLTVNSMDGSFVILLSSSLTNSTRVRRRFIGTVEMLISL